MRRTQIFIAAFLLATPAPLLAQNAPDADATEQRGDDDGNPRLGLLGLIVALGVSGLGGADRVRILRGPSRPSG